MPVVSPIRGAAARSSPERRVVPDDPNGPYGPRGTRRTVAFGTSPGSIGEARACGSKPRCGSGLLLPCSPALSTTRASLVRLRVRSVVGLGAVVVLALRARGRAGEEKRVSFLSLPPPRP